MSAPVFVLLYGGWHTLKCWSRLLTELEKATYTAVAPALPSSNSNPHTSGLDEDIKIIRQAVSDLVASRDVVVVIHSLSGMAGSTALDGLDKKTCLAKGLKGGVIRLIYVQAWLVAEGFSVSPRGSIEPIQMAPEMRIDVEVITYSDSKGTVTVLPEDAKSMLYLDVDDETVAELAQDLRPRTLESFWSKTEHAAWRFIPTTYIGCLQDTPTNVVVARSLVDTAKASGNHKIDNIIEHDVGHCPCISQPEWMAKSLIEEAERTVAS